MTNDRINFFETADAGRSVYPQRIVDSQGNGFATANYADVNPSISVGNKLESFAKQTVYKNQPGALTVDRTAYPGDLLGSITKSDGAWIYFDNGTMVANNLLQLRNYEPVSIMDSIKTVLGINPNVGPQVTQAVQQATLTSIKASSPTVGAAVATAETAKSVVDSIEANWKVILGAIVGLMIFLIILKLI